MFIFFVNYGIPTIKIFLIDIFIFYIQEKTTLFLAPGKNLFLDLNTLQIRKHVN